MLRICINLIIKCHGAFAQIRRSGGRRNIGNNWWADRPLCIGDRCRHLQLDTKVRIKNCSPAAFLGGPKTIRLPVTVGTVETTNGSQRALNGCSAGGVAVLIRALHLLTIKLCAVTEFALIGAVKSTTIGYFWRRTSTFWRNIGNRKSTPPGYSQNQHSQY